MAEKENWGLSDPVVPETEAPTWGATDAVVPYEDRVRDAAVTVAGELEPAFKEDLRRSITDPVETLRTKAAAGVFSLRIQNRLDAQQEDRYQTFAAENAAVPPAQLVKARQIQIVRPQYDISYILKNLPQMEAEVRAEKIPWELVAGEHPTLSKYLQDPSTISQTLQDTASLTGIHRAVGGNVSVFGPDGVPVQKFQLPGWLMAAKDSLVNNMGELYANYGKQFYSAIYASLKKSDDPSKELKRILPDMVVEEFQKWMPEKEQQAHVEYWAKLAEKYGSAATHSKDYRGFFDQDAASFAEKIGRTAEWGAEMISQQAGILAMMAGGHVSAGMKGVLAVNSAYSAMDIFPRALEATGEPGKAVAVTAAGAPLMGRLMAWSPSARAVGVGAESLVREHVSKTLAAALETKAYPLMARSIVLKGGWDVATGQIIIGLQSATAASIDQLALGWGGKPTDPAAIREAFRDGLTNIDMIPLSLMGTARTLVSDIGSGYRARNMAKSIDALKEHLTAAKLPVEDAKLHEQQVREVATRSDQPVFYMPLERFNEVLAAAKLDPKEVATQIMGDRGIGYDRAVSEGSLHLSIPIEKMRQVFASEHLGELAINEGRLDRDILSRKEAQTAADNFSEAFDANVKVDPEKLTGGDRRIYDAVKSEGKKTPQEIAQIYGVMKAVQNRHPEFTVQEIHETLWGPAGIYAPLDARVRATKVSPDSLTFTHETAPLRMKVEIHPENGEYPNSVVVTGYDIQVTAGSKPGEYTRLQETLRGKGLTTSIYLAALEHAKQAGLNWVSDKLRTSDTERMYDRLKKFGLKVETIPDVFSDLLEIPGVTRYKISAETLRSVDFNAIRRVLAEQWKTPVRPEPVEKNETWVSDATRKAEADMGVDTTAVWEKVFSDPKQQAAYMVELKAARLALQERVTRAVTKKFERGLKKKLEEPDLELPLKQLILEDAQSLAQAAMDAAHNEKTLVPMLSRLRRLGEQIDPLRKARSVATPEMWKEFAEKVLENRTLRDIRPVDFVRAGKRAGERALESFSEGDLGRAFDATEQQILNYYLYTSARQVELKIGKIHTELVNRAESTGIKAILGKADSAYREFHSELLGSLGIGETKGNPETLDRFLDRVEQNMQGDQSAAGQESGWDPVVVRSLLTGTRTWKDLKISEAEQVFRAVKNIQHIAGARTNELKALRQAERDVLLQDAAEFLSGQAEHPTYQDITQTPIEVLQIAKEGAVGVFGWAGAYLNAPRVILGFLGPLVQKKLFGGFMDARLAEQRFLTEVYLPWKETQTRWEKDPEFYKPLPGLEKTLSMEGLVGPLSKHHLIQILKWIGSESGRKKALKGLGVPVDAVLKAAGKHLTPEDMSNIQLEHKFFDEKLFPLKAEAWERRKGLPLEKVEPLGYDITFSDGRTIHYDGGYYPVHWDRRPGVEKHTKPVDPSQLPTMYPTVPSGSFKERTEFVGTPDFNWDAVPSHLLADIHNVAFGDFVQEANRVLLHPEMLKNIRLYLGEEYAAWPRAWLERVALESTGSMPEHLEGLGRAGRYARSALTVGALGFNLPLLAGDLVHPMATAVMRDGWAMSVTYAAPAMMKIGQGSAAGLMTGVDPVHAEIVSKSEVVRLREDSLPQNMQRWYHGTYQKGAQPGFLATTEIIRDHVSNTAFWHLRQSDRLVTDMIWEAKYRSVLDKTGNETLAREEADTQVLASMPDYNVMAAPAILAEKNNAIAATCLVFHSYWSKLLEMSNEQRHLMVLQGAEGLPSKSIQAAIWAGRTMAMLTFAVVGGDFMQGQGKQADEDWQTWLIRKELAAPAKLFPYASALTQPLTDALVRGDPRPRDILMSNPYFAPVEKTMSAVTSLLNARKPDEEKILGLIGAGLMLARLPSTSVTRAAAYNYRALSGEEKPTGVLDYLGGTVYGRKTGRSARFSASNPFSVVDDLLEE